MLSAFGIIIGVSIRTVVAVSEGIIVVASVVGFDISVSDGIVIVVSNGTFSTVNAVIAGVITVNVVTVIVHNFRYNVFHFHINCNHHHPFNSH